MTEAAHEDALARSLEGTGIPLGRGFRDIFAHRDNMYPVCALWHESEIPNREEVGLLLEIAQARIGRREQRYTRGLYALEENTLIFSKFGDNWTYIRHTQTLWVPKGGRQRWHTPATLEVLRTSIP